MLQPAVFASLAAALVLPSLFGPALAAFVAHALGWRWFFLGVVVVLALRRMLPPGRWSPVAACPR